MGRRNRRGLRPELEGFERRQLPSGIIATMAANSLSLLSHRGHASLAGGGGGAGSGIGGSQGGGTSGSGANSFSPNYGATVTLGHATLTQGPLLNPNGTINNMALAPTGLPKPGQVKRQIFTARFVGPYSIVPGRTTTQAAQVLIQGGGSANTMLHSDVQIRIVQPKDPSLPFGGVGTIFDRNINSNSALGFNIAAAQQPPSLDRAGRPSHFTQVSIDTNISAGSYVEAYGQGVLNIHYLPSGRRGPGGIQQGTAIVTLHMNIYTADASYLLRNVAYNA